MKHVIPDARYPNKCFLIVERDGQGYVGLLKFDDAMLCGQITRILTKHTGYSIRDIGDIELTVAS